MLRIKHPFRLTYLQANLISLVVVGAMIAFLLVITIGYRDTKLGILAMAGLVGLSVGAAIFKWPQLGAYLLVVSVYTNMSSIFIEQGLPGTNKPLIALVFLAVMANRFFSTESLFSLRRAEWFLLAYGGVWLLSSFVARDRYIAVDLVIDFAKDFILILCLIYPLESRPAAWKQTVWLVILAAGVLAGLGTYQVLTGSEQTFFGFSEFIIAEIIKGEADGGRLIGPLDDPNFYGQALVAVLPLAVYRILDESKLLLRLTAGATSLAIVFAALSTYSRGAFLAMVLVLLLIAIERRVKPSLLLGVALAVAVIMPFMPAGFTERLDTLSIFTSDEATVHQDSSFRGRTSEMLTGINMFSDHLFLGVGIGNYPVNYQDYAGRLGLEQRTEDRNAHSLYLEMAAETGLFGLLTFAGLVGSLLLGLRRAGRRLNRLAGHRSWSSWSTSLQMSLVAYLTTSIFLHNDYLRYLWLIMGLSMALIHLAQNSTRSSLTPLSTPRYRQ